MLCVLLNMNSLNESMSGHPPPMARSPIKERQVKERIKKTEQRKRKNTGTEERNEMNEKRRNVYPGKKKMSKEERNERRRNKYHANKSDDGVREYKNSQEQKRYHANKNEDGVRENTNSQKNKIYHANKTKMEYESIKTVKRKRDITPIKTRLESGKKVWTDNMIRATTGIISKLKLSNLSKQQRRWKKE